MTTSTSSTQAATLILSQAVAFSRRTFHQLLDLSYMTVLRFFLALTISYWCLAKLLEKLSSLSFELTWGAETVLEASIFVSVAIFLLFIPKFAKCETKGWIAGVLAGYVCVGIFLVYYSCSWHGYYTFTECFITGRSSY